uniref:Uncharacterized protein n=1 Tax=Meloidogyne enterolobii TaxID=390850 RepID=A0A6V7XSD5_MELEN|nr:unnamed protein product [Meloidogyne enterolobii]
MRFKQCLFILHIILLQICSAPQTFDIDIKSYVHDLEIELENLKATIAYKSKIIRQNSNWSIQPEEVQKYLLDVEEADFSAIQNYVGKFGGDNKGQDHAGENAQSADFTSLTMAFGVLDKMMFTRDDFNVVNKYNNKIKHFFEYRERINVISDNIQIQFLIGQPAQIFKKVGKDIGGIISSSNTMQNYCKKLFERSELWKIMNNEKQKFIEQETTNIKKYCKLLNKLDHLTEEQQNLLYPQSVKLMRVDLAKTTKEIETLNDVLDDKRKKIEAKEKAKKFVAHS